ncbi:MAG: LysR family transcriptional regulator [Rhizobiaceae bacterium]
MINWEDIKLFVTVARSGGLAAAAGATRSSPPTLGRKMTRLERATGRTLFVRHRSSYELTDAGEELLALAESLELSAAAIDRWRMQSDPVPVVRIAAGPWTASFLAAHLTELRGEEGVQIEMLSGSAPVDLMRREAQIGLRNQRPDGRGLAGQKLARVEFAVYGKTTGRASDAALMPVQTIEGSEWIELAGPGPQTPSSRWLDRKTAGALPIRLPSTHAVLEAIAAGAGHGVLPCFIGDRNVSLERISSPIAELAHDQWLVSHDEDRHVQPVRKVIDRLANLVRANRPLFAGGLSDQGSDPLKHEDGRPSRQGGQ